MERYTLFFSLTSESESLRNAYLEQASKTRQSSDSGFDLFMPEETIVMAGQSMLIDLHIRFEPQFNGGYYLYPRSSFGKTPLRMNNSVGIIDNGYRGTVKAWVTNTSDRNFVMKKGERYFQVCHPSLLPLNLEMVDEVNMNTERGEGGFGSSGR